MPQLDLTIFPTLFFTTVFVYISMVYICENITLSALLILLPVIEDINPIEGLKNKWLTTLSRANRKHIFYAPLLLVYNTFESFESFPILHNIVINSTTNSVLALTPYMLLGVLVMGTGFAFGAISQYLYSTVKDISTNNKLAIHIFSIVFSLFILIATLNVYGLTGGSFSATGHIIVTATLAVLIFFYGFFLALRVNFLELFSIVKAHGVPKIITPLVMAIETLSVSIRPISLAVRLFSNILAGHILLHMTKDNVKNSAESYNLIAFIGGLIGLIAVGTLESGVSIIQPYVFFLLSIIYIFDFLLRGDIRFSRSNKFILNCC